MLPLKRRSCLVVASAILPRFWDVLVKTIRRGLQERKDLRTLPTDRIRHTGGGAKPKIGTIPGIDAAFLEIVEHYTAGDPMREDVLWTNLAHTETCWRAVCLGNL